MAHQISAWLRPTRLLECLAPNRLPRLRHDKAPATGKRQMSDPVGRKLLAANFVRVMALPSSDSMQTFERDLDRLRSDLNIPGISVAVLQEQKIVFSRGFGYADLENEIPATEKTAYEIASLTKPFAAAILMQLVEAGLLDLDAAMADILRDTVFTFPKLADNDIQGYAELCKFLMDLSKATSGPYARFAFLFQEYHGDANLITVKHHLTHTAQGKPGEAYRYNGFLYGLLSYVVEAVTEESFEERLANNIIAPLEMTDTVPNASTRRRAEIMVEMAKPYKLDDAGKIVRAKYQSEGRATAASGMISTVLDLAKFDAAMDRDQVVSAESKTAMFTPTISSRDETLPYGMGWFVQDHQGTRLIWHYGWETAYSSLIVKIPTRGFTFLLLANSDGASSPFDLGSGDVLQSPFAALFLTRFPLEEDGKDDL